MTIYHSLRVNYDQIAHLYDSQPYRQKAADPHLERYIQERPDRLETLSVLDLSCGTGNQLIANRAIAPTARLIGLDFFAGMLHQARSKAAAASIAWVQADGAHLPFAGDAFDYISNQFAFHHIHDKPAMLRAVFRLLRPGGRFVMINSCPEEMRNWLYYRFFPASWEIDSRDFMPKDEILDQLRQAGFDNIQFDLQRLDSEQDLGEFLQTVRRRDICSQLIAISDADYQAGLEQLEKMVEQVGPTRAKNEFCLITVYADKNPGMQAKP